MASKPVKEISAAEKEQLAVSYAAFVLSAQGADVTNESIEKVLKAANIQASKSLVKAFSKLLATRKVNEFFGAGGSGGAAEAKTEPASSSKKDEPKAQVVAPPPPPPPVEEEEMDMGGLFD